MLHPGKITVILHDTIDTTATGRDEVDSLRDCVHEIVSTPVEAFMRERRQPFD
jgi:hypothetical protein